MIRELSFQASLKHLVAKSQAEGDKSAFYVVLDARSQNWCCISKCWWCSCKPWALLSPFSKEFVTGTIRQSEDEGLFPEAVFSWYRHRGSSKILLLSSWCGEHREYIQVSATTDLTIWQQKDTLSIDFFHFFWEHSILSSVISSNICSPGSIKLYQIGSDMQGVSGRK